VKNAEKASYRHRARMHPRKPASGLAERWTMIDGVDVFYRESANPPDARVMMHVHGFGLSGRYLLPTAELLADEFHTLVPDLPGFGRSGKGQASLDIPDLAHAAARFLDDRGVRTASLVGNSPSASSAPCSCRLRAASTISRSGGRWGSSPPTAAGSPGR
jgi:hypothetical protein